MSWDPVTEHNAGVLCEKGFMKERYDSTIDELVRTFTPNGIEVVKKILKDPKYQREFMIMIYNETRGLNKDEKFGVVNEIKEMLIN